MNRTATIPSAGEKSKSGLRASYDGARNLLSISAPRPIESSHNHVAISFPALPLSRFHATHKAGSPARSKCHTSDFNSTWECRRLALFLSRSRVEPIAHVGGRKVWVTKPERIEA
jgi:hypothetical protein